MLKPEILARRRLYWLVVAHACACIFSATYLLASVALDVLGRR